MTNPSGAPAPDQSPGQVPDAGRESALDHDVPVPGGADDAATDGREEAAGAFRDYPGPQGTLGAMPGSDMTAEPGGTGEVGNFEPVDLPDE